MSTIKRSQTLGLIPARAGSKRLQGKNIRHLGGHPLVAWTIRAALSTGCFDRVIVSTDSREIADISIGYGAEVPFLRPTQLGGDQVPTLDVIIHLLDTLQADNCLVDELCILQPTSPYRTADDIIASRKVFKEKEANAVVSVVPCSHSPLWMNTLGAGGTMDNFIPKEHLNKRSQDLPSFHRLNGAIYWYKADVYRSSGTPIPQKTFAYEMDELRSVDIDTALDFEYAEFLLQRGYVSRI